MPDRTSIHYFGAGPATLLTSVLETASTSILNHASTGLGLIEHSHRSALSGEIITSAASHYKSLLGLPPNDDTYTVLFMQGGGTTQFSSVAYNLIGYWVERRLRRYGGDIEKVRQDLKGMKCDYILTGGWSSKASEEAKRLFGEEHVNVAAESRIGKDGKKGKWETITPEADWKLTPKKSSAFTYYCDNETVDGVEFPGFPEILKPTNAANGASNGASEDDDERIVAVDMSSNILSRSLPDLTKNYSLIFCGAQKNIGATGITLVLLRTSILTTQPTTSTLRALNLPIPPIMMHYPTLATAGSLYNTLPIFEVFIAREVMALLIATGGLAAISASAHRKSSSIYAVIDAHPETYTPVITDTRVRSRMNVCFRITGDSDKEKLFFKKAEERGLTGLKGHRSVGGVRASCYNAVGEESVKLLVDYMEEFAKGGGKFLALN